MPAICNDLAGSLLSIHADLALAIFHADRGEHDKARDKMIEASDALHALRDDVEGGAP